MSKANPLTKLVADVVRERGHGVTTTIAHVQELFPEARRRDLMKALHNAAHSGFIRLVKKGRGHNNGEWAPGEVPTRSPMVSSVFQLGNPLPESDWPKGWMGTTHRPLGPWHSEETDESGMAATR